MVVEELGFGVDVLINGPTTLDSDQSVSAQLRPVFVDGRRILKGNFVKVLPQFAQ
jgi:hypothetical protein